MCLALLSFPIPSDQWTYFYHNKSMLSAKLLKLRSLLMKHCPLTPFTVVRHMMLCFFVASIGINFHPSAFEYFLGFSFNRRGEEKKTKIETIIWELRTMGTSTSCTTYPMRAHPKRGKWISFGLLLNWHLIIFFAFCRMLILLTHGEGRRVSSCHLNIGFVIGISRERVFSSWRNTR